eukprot:10464241-Ditylum_brightwellii.AAC.1
MPGKGGSQSSTTMHTMVDLQIKSSPMPCRSQARLSPTAQPMLTIKMVKQKRWLEICLNVPESSYYMPCLGG